MLLKQFERARLDADRPRIRGRLARAVDEPHGNVRARETHRGGEASGTRADDQDRRHIMAAVSMRNSAEHSAN